ncbi:MAG TPA: hypothetical protein VMX75_07915, partial [Spirochaetia bacterium]|nr:hypothetical protein [Spirochaetia bacterium]
SILDDKGKERFYGSKGQLFLPGTWHRIVIALFLILGMPPLLYRTVKLGTRVVRRYRRVLERQLPRTRLLHALERLRKGLSETDPRDFFIQVTRVLRDYFSGRLQLQAHTATTLELEHLLPERLSQFCLQPDAENLSERVVALFKKADGIKFGGRGATENEMIETIDQASEICGSVEEVVQSVEL